MIEKIFHRGQVSRDIILTGISRVGVTLAGAAAGIVLARLLGVEEYGRFAFAYSVLLFVLIFAKLGLDGAAVMFVAEYRAKKEFGKLLGFIKIGRSWLFHTSVIGVLLAVLLALIFELDDVSYLFMITTLPTLVLIAQLHFDQSVMHGFQKTALSQLPEGFVRAVILCALLTTCWMLALCDLTAEIAFLLNGIALFAALFLARIYVNLLSQKYQKEVKGLEHEEKRWFFTGAAYLFIGCSQVVLAQTDVVMLGLLSDNETVGYYAVAAQVSVLLLFFGSAINPVFMPRVASAFSKKDFVTLHSDARMCTNLTFALSVPVLLVLYIFRVEILSLLFGEPYVAAAGALSILLLAQLAKIMSMAGFVMTMTEGAATTSYVVAGAAVLNVILNLLLIPQYGAIGAATATTCSSFCWNIILILIVKRRFGVLLLPFVKLKKQAA